MLCTNMAGGRNRTHLCFDVLHLFEARNEVDAIAIASTQQYFDGIHLFGAKGEVESLLNEASKIQVRLKSLLHEHSHFQYYLKD